MPGQPLVTVWTGLQAVPFCFRGPLHLVLSPPPSNAPLTYLLSFTPLCLQETHLDKGPASQESPGPPSPNLTSHTALLTSPADSFQIIGPLHTPLPPTLPPSPPVSRSNSPAPASIKRKYDAPADPEHFKRPRTSSILSDRPPHHHKHTLSSSHLHPPHLRVSGDTSAHLSRNEPCEDGELREEPPVASTSRLPAGTTVAIPPNTVPIRRPKRGRTDVRHHDLLHDKYHHEGRMLKYSGDARFWSTYPVTHREYRPLLDPPPPNSAYYRHGGLIARLELVDALVCFTFALWNKDYGRKACVRSSWLTIDAFLAWCKAKWLAEEGMIDAEKAFIGLIYLIEGFIHVRKLTYMANGHLEKEVSKLYEELRPEVDMAGLKAEKGQLSAENLSLLAPKAQATPPMLPSPASIVPANSANSTPTTRDAGTPNPLVPEGSASAPQRPAHNAAQVFIRGRMLPDRYKDNSIPAHVMDGMLSVTTTVGVSFIQNLKEQTSGTTAASYCMIHSQASLNLTTLRLHFPTTFARVINTTLSPTEEHEPDFEDEQGELYWPGQSITGEGLGWVCLLGKAMIKEFGKAYGYRGLDGVVPKPKPEEAALNTGPPTQGPPQHQRPGSTPHGNTPHGYSSQSTASSSVPR
ncbi:hypothetical protein D9615_004524 [Tricholomella constricta]|uniref:Uncharacterized protein n=1 Tax=Tricholomella constricta TaxID=117010 RepID=A0A8H5HBY9_9AGAR|nr:hypothetical protein D9615_004524 [Tricholomella constricta]